jgi:hypothetical protein
MLLSDVAAPLATAPPAAVVSSGADVVPIAAVLSVAAAELFAESLLELQAPSATLAATATAKLPNRENRVFIMIILQVTAPRRTPRITHSVSQEAYAPPIRSYRTLVL